jgi:hypothetical protein
MQAMFFRLSSLRILHLDMDAVRAAHKPPIGLPGLFSALRGHQNLQRVSLEFHPMDLQNPDAGEDLVDSLNFELGATGRPERVLASEVDEEGHDLFMDAWFWVADEGGWW